MGNEVFELNLQIGQLMGQVQALMSTVGEMSAAITRLEERLRKNEENTTVLTVKMSLVGVISGGLGSLLISLVGKMLTKTLSGL